MDFSPSYSSVADFILSYTLFYYPTMDYWTKRIGQGDIEVYQQLLGLARINMDKSVSLEHFVISLRCKW